MAGTPIQVDLTNETAPDWTAQGATTPPAQLQTCASCLQDIDTAAVGPDVSSEWPTCRHPIHLQCGIQLPLDVTCRKFLRALVGPPSNIDWLRPWHEILHDWNGKVQSVTLEHGMKLWSHWQYIALQCHMMGGSNGY